MVRSNIKTEIINIGDEILIGQIVNTNASWMAQQLNLSGFSVVHMTAISDTRQAILDALRQASERADIILITGGLGPTKDDITKQILADFFNVPLVPNEKVLEEVRAFFAARGQTLTDTNRRQAEVPENCTALSNPYGTAPGMWIADNGKVYASMPGVPIEMKHLMSDEIIPRLRATYQPGHIVHKTVMTHGMGESHLSDRIRKWEESLPSHIQLAYLPRAGIVRMRLSAAGSDQTALEQDIRKAIDDLKGYIPELIFGYDDITLEEVIGQLLKKRGATVATAESCTGGAIAARITRIAGSSAYFRGSIVAYANDVKEQRLGVSAELLQRYGAVSQHVVEQMARGAREEIKADYAIATSGIAGPEGGSAEKPVGTIWIAVASPEKTVSQKFQFGAERSRNNERSVLSGLNMLRKVLLED